MRILTEAEYERRLEEARLKGYEEAAEQIRRDQRENDFREDIWRAIRDIREDTDRKTRMILMELEKLGIHDPFEPPKYTGTCVEKSTTVAKGTTIGTAPDGSPIVYTGR